MTQEEMNEKLAEIKNLFESITCLCAEGPEFMGKLQLVDAIRKEAHKGFDICKIIFTEQSNPSDASTYTAKVVKCERCGGVGAYFKCVGQ